MTDAMHGQSCPHCDHSYDTAISVNTTDPNAVPTPGAISICPYCGETAVFGDDVRLRKPTDAELEEFGQDERYRKLRRRTRRHIREQWQTRSHPDGEEDGEDGRLRALAIQVGIDSDGEIELPDGMPAKLADLLVPVLRQVLVQMMGADLLEHVTPEVANHVLSAYGNEEATMPSLAVGTLISLIRICHESDDHLLSELDKVSYLHGYVLAVTQLAERGPEMVEMLEMLAGLRDPDEVTGK